MGSTGTLGGSGSGNGRLVFPIPPVETVPGADNMSVTALTLYAGSARTTRGGHAFSLRMPARCPRGSLTYTLQASFGGPAPSQVSTAYRARCPRR